MGNFLNIKFGQMGRRVRSTEGGSENGYGSMK